MKNALVAMAGLLSWLCLAEAFAFSAIPGESAKALGSTKNRKSIDSGLVFVNGRFISPPYVVERWGTGIRVNGVQVTGQVVDWADFLRTQNVPARPPETKSPAAPPVESVPAPEPDAGPDPEFQQTEDFEDISCELDFLFSDDEPASRQKKPTKAKPARPGQKKTSETASGRPAAQQPAAAPAGEFAMNDAAKALLARVNAARTTIDRALRGGGFICFGDGYSRLSGDRKSADRLMARLPEILHRAESAKALKDAARAAGLPYLHDAVCDDLFTNRIGYRTLQEHRARVRKDREWKALLDSGGGR